MAHEITLNVGGGDDSRVKPHLATHSMMNPNTLNDSQQDMFRCHLRASLVSTQAC